MAHVQYRIPKSYPVNVIKNPYTINHSGQVKDVTPHKQVVNIYILRTYLAFSYMEILALVTGFANSMQKQPRGNAHATLIILENDAI